MFFEEPPDVAPSGQPSHDFFEPFDAPDGFHEVGVVEDEINAILEGRGLWAKASFVEHVVSRSRFPNNASASDFARQFDFGRGKCFHVRPIYSHHVACCKSHPGIIDRCQSSDSDRPRGARGSTAACCLTVAYDAEVSCSFAVTGLGLTPGEVWKDTMADLPQSIRVGISACLLGEEVRYNGGHKHDAFLTKSLGRYFSWVPCCPEAEVGLGVPRESIRLVQAEGGTQLRTSRTDVDLTDRMSKFVSKRVENLRNQGLSGFVLKKDSPSCGLSRVKVYHPKGQADRSGTGLFAAALVNSMPTLPVEEEGRLRDARLRENWIERVFAYHALQQLWKTDWKPADVIAFHTQYKLTLLAHDAERYRRLGRLVAQIKQVPKQQFRQCYEAEFMAAMQRIATVRNHVNVLQHAVGYFSKQLDPGTRGEIISCIEDYRQSFVALSVPLTMIHHFVRRFQVQYLLQQAYFCPFPKELGLRNYV